jgi:hypothetical protein
MKTTILFVTLSALAALAEEPSADAPTANETLAVPAPRVLRTEGHAVRYEYLGTVPEGFTLREEPRWALLAGGVGAFGGGYLLAALVGAYDGTGLGMVPVVGPLLTMVAHCNRPTSNPAGLAGALVDTGVFVTLGALSVIETAAQVAGITMFTLSLIKSRKWLERSDRVTITLLPVAPGAQAGASLVAHF